MRRGDAMKDNILWFLRGFPPPPLQHKNPPQTEQLSPEIKRWNEMRWDRKEDDRYFFSSSGSGGLSLSPHLAIEPSLNPSMDNSVNPDKLSPPPFPSINAPGPDDPSDWRTNLSEIREGNWFSSSFPSFPLNPLLNRKLWISRISSIFQPNFPKINQIPCRCSSATQFVPPIRFYN